MKTAGNDRSGQRSFSDFHSIVTRPLLFKLLKLSGLHKNKGSSSRQASNKGLIQERKYSLALECFDAFVSEVCASVCVCAWWDIKQVSGCVSICSSEGSDSPII